MESKPFITSNTACFEDTDLNWQVISSENPCNAVHDAATLVGLVITNCPGIVIIMMAPFAMTIPAGVDPTIVKLVYDCPVSISVGAIDIQMYGEGCA